MTTQTYDFRDVQLVIGSPIFGFAPDSPIRLTFDDDLYAKTVGADGEVSRARKNNLSAMLEVTLLQTSGGNDILMGLAVLDRASNGGIVPLLLKDFTGRTLVAAAECWVKKLPDIEYGTTDAYRTWPIDMGRVDVFVGGN